jgi:hypothetical protein
VIDFDWRTAAAADIQVVLRDRSRSLRKVRLFCVACCRARADRLGHPLCHDLLGLAEAFADDGSAAARARMAAGRQRVRGWALSAGRADSVGYDVAEYFRRWAVVLAATPKLLPLPEPFLDPAELFRDLLADIFDDPFRPVTFNPEWRTSAAVQLAAQMYEARDFAHMPILADALQDAGCEHPAVLAHCRDPHATHVRGCWVVDLVLGKG